MPAFAMVAIGLLQKAFSARTLEALYEWKGQEWAPFSSTCATETSFQSSSV